MKRSVLWILIIFVVLVGLTAAYWFQGRSVKTTTENLSVNDNWLTYSDVEQNLEFKYPEQLGTKYIHVLDWPPKAQVLRQSFNCAEGGEEIARAGKTEKRLVDNREYCRTTVVEGAAGSIYTQYAYAFASGNSTVIFTFSTRAVQCANYDEAERSICEAEREAFDLDGVVDRMAKSVVIK